jgi:two-component system, chemotaxis family, chemotaxis protein CheY
MTAVLIIDDSLTTTMSLKSALDMAGFAVTAFNDGPTALGHIDRGYKPDMVITDINMPGMNGLEVIQHVRERLRFTPIVALSAEKTAATREQARERGASGWLAKPVSAEDLIKVIRQLVPGA